MQRVYRSWERRVTRQDVPGVSQHDMAWMLTGVENVQVRRKKLLHSQRNIPRLYVLWETGGAT